MILNDFENKFSWRHFEAMYDPGGGASGSDFMGYVPAPLLGPSDPSLGSPVDQGWRPTTSSLPANSYDPGPAKARSYYHQPAAPASASPPDPWANVSAQAHDAATNLTDKFAATLGWPRLGWNSAALQLAQSGINLSSPFDAYAWLFQHEVTPDVQAANPWAEFGMIKDDYITTINHLNSVFFDWTGNSALDGGAMKQAIREGWTPDQIRNFAVYGNPSGSGSALPQAQFLGDMPWLSIGQTYSQTLQQFQTFEQHAPSDKATLAAFFRFGESAKQIGVSHDAVGATTQKRGQESIVR